MKHTESYIKTCCSADCHYFSDQDEPCWGEVVVVDELYDEEGSWWIHECEGHRDCYSEGGKYKPEIK